MFLIQNLQLIKLKHLSKHAVAILKLVSLLYIHEHHVPYGCLQGLLLYRNSDHTMRDTQEAHPLYPAFRSPHSNPLMRTSGVLHPHLVQSLEQYVVLPFVLGSPYLMQQAEECQHPTPVRNMHSLGPPSM